MLAFLFLLLLFRGARDVCLIILYTLRIRHVVCLCGSNMKLSSMCANKASIHGGKLINLSGQQIYRTMALEVGKKMLFIIPISPFLCGGCNRIARHKRGINLFLLDINFMPLILRFPNQRIGANIEFEFKVKMFCKVSYWLGIIDRFRLNRSNIIIYMFGFIYMPLILRFPNQRIGTNIEFEYKVEMICWVSQRMRIIDRFRFNRSNFSKYILSYTYIQMKNI